MSEKKNYKSSLERLQAIVEQLEAGTEDLDQLQALVKEATKLLSYCKGQLRGAEGQLEEALKALEDE